MSIVALKRKTRAKFNISNANHTLIAPISNPGKNAKRGLVSRTNGSVVNRNSRVAARTQHPMGPNDAVIIQDGGDVDFVGGFYLNGTHRIKAAQAKDTNLMKQGTDSCCSDDSSIVKRSVLTTKGMLQTRQFRFKDNNPNSECCEDIVNTHIEKHTMKSSEVVERRKLAAQNCPDHDGKLIFCKPCKKSHDPKCTPGCKNQPPISHDVCVASSQSDYLMRKKMGVQHQMTLKKNVVLMV